jgi:hypothetical protein
MPEFLDVCRAVLKHHGYDVSALKSGS